MKHPLRGTLVGPWRSAIALLASATVLVGALVNARVVVLEHNELRERYGPLEPARREDEIVRSLGFDPDVWERLRSSVHAGDRFNIVAQGVGQHEVRNYAAYSLLPAIQVSDSSAANVVVYYEIDPPSAARCTPVGERVCVVRRKAP